MKNIPWIDIETNGLDEKAPGAKILEITCIVTSPSLEEIDRLSLVVHHELTDEELSTWPSRVQQMHLKNNLIMECRESLLSPFDVDECMGYFIHRYARGGQMAGQSVGFDHRWIKELMPATSKACHGYRMLDNRALITAAEMWGGFDLKDIKSPYTHRATEDIEWSLEVARYIKAAHFDL